MYLLYCKNCGTIYKIVNVEDFGEYKVYTTDFGDEFIITNDYFVCKKCAGLTKDIIKTDDWIADLVFKVKGF